MTFNCKAAFKSVEFCCWLLCKGPISKDMLHIVIKSELGKHIFFRNVPILVMRVGEKISPAFYSFFWRSSLIKLVFVLI